MASPSSSAPAESGFHAPSGFKVVGIILAISSGALIGSSFVFKKKGLLSAASKGASAGDGNVAYLKSPLWWTGMIMMILGEVCNFAAYAFVEAVVVTPMGALSVVICAILSSLFLQETLTFFGWIGCFLCIVGSVIIALNGPAEQSVSTIHEFQKLFLSPGFLVYGGLIIAIALVIIFLVAPKYGKDQMIWYILVCSLFGGLSVSCTQGLGTAIVTTARGNNQFKFWFTYFLLVFVAATLLTEIYYLNMALALFNTAMVTPTYYVIFTFFTLVTSIILYQGLKAPVVDIITIVMGFFVICAGIIILQMSKVDPQSLKKLDRKSTILLEASRRNTELTEKSISGIEDPGMDALRGTFGAVGSIVRARSAKRMSQMSSVGGSTTGARYGQRHGTGHQQLLSTHGLDHLPRHQLYDAPVPRLNNPPPLPEDASERISMFSSVAQPGTPNFPPPNSPGDPKKPRGQSIKFDPKDKMHFYPSPGLPGHVRHDSQPSHLPPIPASDPSSESSTERGDPFEAPMTGSFPPPHHRSTGSGPSSPVTAPPATRPRASYLDPFSDERSVMGPESAGIPSSTMSTFDSRDTRDPLGSSSEDGSEDGSQRMNVEQGFRKPAKGSSRYASGDESRSLVREESEEGIRSGGIRLLPSQRR
jgi:drug/metabolite transporter (DMT)-like permease